MITDVIKNSSVNTKIHAKMKGGLRESDYEFLIQMKSVSEVAHYLKENTRYNAVLSGIDVDTVHRGYLEKLVQKQIEIDINSLLLFASSSAKFFLRIFVIRDEISYIKDYLRRVFTGTEKQFDYSLKTENVDFSKLKGKYGFVGMLEAFDKTPYYRIFKSFADYPERQNLFELEMALDGFYRKTVYKYVNKYLDGKEKKSVLQTYGLTSDFENIMFIVRAKKYYNFKAEQIYPYVKAKNYRLSDDIINRMVNAKTVDEAVGTLKDTAYNDLFDDKNCFYERTLKGYELKVHERMFMKHPYSIEAILYYIKKKEIEIKNIITLIEGIRYDLMPEEIRKCIIGISQ